MLPYALLVFLIGACGGLVVASFVLRGRLAPWAVSLLHALFGATGLTLLTVAIFMDDLGTLPVVALGTLVVTALLGFYLASLHLDRRIAVKKLVLTHAGLAVTGVVLLAVAILSS